MYLHLLHSSSAVLWCTSLSQQCFSVYSVATCCSVSLSQLCYIIYYYLLMVFLQCFTVRYNVSQCITQFHSVLKCMTWFHGVFQWFTVYFSISAVVQCDYSLEAVSVLQVQHQAVSTEVHFVLGLCHLQEGQTQTTQQR